MTKECSVQVGFQLVKNGVVADDLLAYEKTQK